MSQLPWVKTLSAMPFFYYYYYYFFIEKKAMCMRKIFFLIAFLGPFFSALQPTFFFLTTKK